MSAWSLLWENYDLCQLSISLSNILHLLRCAPLSNAHLSVCIDTLTESQLFSIGQRLCHKMSTDARATTLESVYPYRYFVRVFAKDVDFRGSIKVSVERKDVDWNVADTSVSLKHYKRNNKLLTLVCTKTNSHLSLQHLKTKPRDPHPGKSDTNASHKYIYRQWIK